MKKENANQNEMKYRIEYIENHHLDKCNTEIFSSITIRDDEDDNDTFAKNRITKPFHKRLRYIEIVMVVVVVVGHVERASCNGQIKISVCTPVRNHFLGCRSFCGCLVVASINAHHSTFLQHHTY